MRGSEGTKAIKKALCGLFVFFLCCTCAYAAEGGVPDVVIQPGDPQYTDTGFSVDLDVKFNNLQLYHDQVLISYHVVDGNGGALLFENEKLALNLASDGTDQIRFYIDCQAILDQVGPVDGGMFIQFDFGDYRDYFWYSFSDTVKLQAKPVPVDVDRFTRTFETTWGTVIATILGVSLLTVLLLKLKKEPVEEKKAAFLHSLGPALLFSFSFALFFPGMLVFGNADDLMVSWTQILPICLAVFTLCAAISLAVLFVLPGRIRELCCAILVGMSVAAYLQFAFLNADYGELNGASIDWSAFRTEGYISAGTWLVCIAVPLVLTLWKRVQTQKALRFASPGLVAFQALILIMAGFTAKPPATDFVLTYDNAFSVSQDSNTIVFVLDTWDGALFRDWLQEDPARVAGLDGFTFFDNAVSGAAPTILGMPALLTGSPYKADRPLDDYYEEVFVRSQLFHLFETNDVDVRILTFASYLSNEAALNVDNAERSTYVISSKSGYARRLYRFSLFTCMPQFLKQNFWLHTGEFSRYLTKADSTSGENAQIYLPSDSQSDVDFYTRLQEAKMSTMEKKAFRFYHLFGLHAPWTMDENIRIGLETTSYERQMEGTLNIVKAYLQKLKEFGLYESATIILSGDHGGMGQKHYDERQFNLYQNPAVCIKPAGESEGFRISHAPITFEEVNATMGVGVTGDPSQFGRTVFDVPEEGRRVRWHTVNKVLNDLVYPDEDHGGGSYDCYTFRIDGDANDMSSVTWVEHWGD